MTELNAVLESFAAITEDLKQRGFMKSHRRRLPEHEIFRRVSLSGKLDNVPV
jgi:hypothetical protein